MKCLLPLLLTQILFVDTIFGHQEHRVHNIVLYPDKNSWCKTLEIKQIISHPGYKSEEIDNNVCVGACFSYSIPHTEPSDPGEVIVPYCDSCQPSETYWKHITLKSEDVTVTNDILASTLLKRVQIITNCSCTSCKKNNGGQGYDDWLRSIDDNDDHDVLDSNDVPDLIDVVNNRNVNNNTTIHHHVPNANNDTIKKLLNHKLIDLLKNIQENNSKYDKIQLIELLKMLKTSDHKISNKNIEEFVETLNEDNIEMDLSKLKEILLKYDTEIGDHEAIKPHNHHQNHHNTDDNSHEHHNRHHLESHENHHHKNQHPHLHHVHHHHHPHPHHVGDIIEGHGHLERGPHGALVINPDDNQHIHEKLLDVNPQELKPNHAGTMLSYSSHSDSKSSLRDDDDDD